jgi:transposase-like protein
VARILDIGEKLIRRWRQQIEQGSPAARLNENKHGVKDAQFENVIVVVRRDWNKYVRQNV